MVLKSDVVKKKVCATGVSKVIIPTNPYVIVSSKYKKGSPSSDFVRFFVHEFHRGGKERKEDGRKVIINDHRKDTLHAARHHLSLKKNGANVAPKTRLLAEVVRLPARVVVVEMGAYTYLNLFPLESRKYQGLLIAFPQFLMEEKLTLDSVVTLKEVWSWGRKKDDYIFGPTGYTLPIVALTDREHRIVMRCSSSRDIIMVGSKIERIPTL